MSHTFSSEEGDLFIYNGDFSGKASITPVDGPVVDVYCSSLLEFAAEYVRMKEISRLEGAEWKELLLNN